MRVIDSMGEKQNSPLPPGFYSTTSTSKNIYIYIYARKRIGIARACRNIRLRFIDLFSISCVINTRIKKKKNESKGNKTFDGENIRYKNHDGILRR